MRSLRGALRWLYPGMRVKRWAALTVVSTAAALYAVLDLLRLAGALGLASAFGITGIGRIAALAAILALSAAGYALGLSRLVRSVARGVAPERRQKPSEMIYHTRVLGRGPQVVAIGGGTGLSTLLRGIKEFTSNIVAVVTVTDDGGSSGRLREQLGMLPPGDIRNCLIALAADEPRIERLFQHRLQGPEALAGHSLGNLMLAGFAQAVGGFDRAVEEVSHVLNVRGRVLPATLAKIDLIARMEDGEWVRGETRIAEDPRRILEVRLSERAVPPHRHVLDAIAEAEVILVGPGSLYTSLVPNLLVDGLAAAIEDAPAEKLLIANIMTQPGETDGYGLSDHLHALHAYVDLRRFDAVLVNREKPDDRLLAAYREEHATLVEDDLGEVPPYGLTVVREDLLGVQPIGGVPTVKHDPRRLARAILRASRAFGSARRSARSSRTDPASP
jgi:uncharacterized cofD-like protein